LISKYQRLYPGVLDELKAVLCEKVKNYWTLIYTVSMTLILMKHHYAKILLAVKKSFHYLNGISKNPDTSIFCKQGLGVLLGINMIL